MILHGSCLIFAPILRTCNESIFCFSCCHAISNNHKWEKWGLILTFLVLPLCNFHYRHLHHHKSNHLLPLQYWSEVSNQYVGHFFLEIQQNWPENHFYFFLTIYLQIWDWLRFQWRLGSDWTKIIIHLRLYWTLLLGVCGISSTGVTIFFQKCGK